MRYAQSKEKDDLERRELVRFKVEEIEREEKRRKEQELRKEEEDKILSEIDNKIETVVSEAEGEEGDSSEWEDIDDAETECPKKDYNTVSLRNFSRECDRYGVTDRAAAKIGNGLLRDFGIVKKGDASKLICPSKLRRERIKVRL